MFGAGLSATQCHGSQVKIIRRDRPHQTNVKQAITEREFRVLSAYKPQNLNQSLFAVSAGYSSSQWAFASSSEVNLQIAAGGTWLQFFNLKSAEAI
jgi:hypothetical protein